MEIDRNYYTEAINQMILGIASLNDETAILQTMVNIMGEALRVDRSLIYDISFSTNLANGLCEWLNPEEKDLASSIGAYPLDLFIGGCSWMFANKTWLESHYDKINPNFLGDVSDKTLHETMNIKSLLWYPFDIQENRYFLLVFNQVSHRRTWTKNEIEFLEIAAKQVSIALRKIRLLHDLAEREKSLLFEQSLFNAGPVVVFRWLANEKWSVEFVSENIVQLGYLPDDFYSGKITFSELVHPEDLTRIKAEIIHFGNKNVDIFEQEYRIILADKKIKYMHDYTKIIRNNKGIITHYHGYIYDITDRKITEEELYKQKEEALVTLQSIGDGVITTDTDQIVRFMNPIAELLTGWENTQAIGKNLKEVFPIINEITRDEAINPVTVALEEKRIVGMANHTVLINKTGKEIPIEDSAAPIQDKYGNALGVVMVFHDVIDARKMARQLEWQASHDSLTEIFNRREFEKQLNLIINSYSINDGEHVLLYLDLDQFKIINDTCGHSAGDELLKQLPSLIQRELGNDAILARLGGDEFGIILKDVSLQDAVKIANKIIKSIHEYRFMFEDHFFEIGASIGLVQIIGQSYSTLLSNADIACYIAKDLGRNRIHIFKENDSDITKRHREMEWISRLNHAFKNHQFLLYHQEIVSLNHSHGNGNFKHFEILLRLETEEKSIISAGKFLAAAERYNLMGDIDNWVIDAAFKNFNENKQSYIAKNISFSINLSGVSLSNDNLLGFIREKILHYNIPPEHICLEITETAAISNLNKVHHLMSELKLLGIKFSLDDFGSGLSSFAYLKHLPVDFIKIDGNFISDIIDDPVDLAIVESINHLGHAMNLKTIAEFVINNHIKEKLQNIGVDYAQGYAIHRPDSLLNIKL